MAAHAAAAAVVIRKRRAAGGSSGVGRPDERSNLFNIPLPRTAPRENPNLLGVPIHVHYREANADHRPISHQDVVTKAKVAPVEPPEDPHPRTTTHITEERGKRQGLMQKLA